MRKFSTLLVVSGLVVASAIVSIAPVSAQFWSWIGRRPRVTLGTRSGVCPMTPGLLEKNSRVISDRPLFTWQGEAVGLIVQDEDTNDIVWETQLTPNMRQIAYGAQQPLQPNKVYRWQLISKPSADPVLAPTDDPWDSVAVISQTEREQHLAKLKELEKTKAGSDEAIASAKADYLLDQDRRLWSDAVQVLSEVKNPSPEFTKYYKKLLTNLCTQS